MSDITKVLMNEHQRIKRLFLRANQSSEDLDIALDVCDELIIHATIEEEIFYPAVSEASDEIREAVVEGIEEHNVVKQLAAEVGVVAPEDETWAAKMKVMIENVEHHAEEEETELWSLVRKALDTTALADLGDRLEARKAELGAPTVADKEHLTTEELKELAKEQEIPGRSSMDREELVATVGLK
jgi:hemerythrin-like domain-containing protein